MRSKVVTLVAGAVLAVVATSLMIGLVSPDGDVGHKQKVPSAAADTPRPATAPLSTRAPTPPTAARAPLAVRGIWPGRPDTVDVADGQVDWCPAVRLTHAAEAEAEFGRKATRTAACAAVDFVFTHRYSTLSLPRPDYSAADFSPALRAFTDSTQETYRSRINQFIASPRDDTALGLVLLRGHGTAGDAISAGAGRVFYGPAGSTRGYRGRSVWINPQWSAVRISVDRTKAEPRIVATFDASAAMPVFNTSVHRDDMLTISTQAQMYLRHAEAGRWLIGGWSKMSTGTPTYSALVVS